ncbi:MAG: class I adenylate-forming enzyme family protein [Betaproteobacteria bacterium]
MNITDPIRLQAIERPHAAAIARSSGTVSYRDLDRTIDVVARRARDLGAVAGQSAAIAIGHPYWHLVLSLGLARIGVTVVPMSLPATAVDICFTTGARPKARYARFEPVDPAWFATPPPTADVSPVPSHQDDSAICIVFASSGTTGFAKHVAVSHALMARRIAAKAHLAPVSADVRQICPLGVGSGYGFRDLLRVLWAGGVVVLARKAGDVVAALSQHAVNCLVVSPSMLDDIVAALPPGAGPFPLLTEIEVGGSLIPGRLYESARQRLCPGIRSSYGATETGSVAAAPMAALLGREGAVGFLVPGVDVRAVDADDRPLPPGTEGILRIRSALCVDHYLGDPAATAIAFRDGWFYPGDIGSVTSDRLLRIAGRSVDLINRGGAKVSPQAIEDVLLSLAQLRDAAAFGVPDEAGLMKIWAAIVPNGVVDVPVLDAVFRQRLPGTAPQFILQMEKLPRNEGGKVMRDELVRMATASRRGR